jgi:hypothetical protein
MTETEFITYAQIPAYVANVNIWYTDTVPYIIQGITVPTISFSGQNIISLLDQIQQITIPGDNSIDITLDILTRQLYTTPNGSFYYFTVTPYQVTSVITTTFLSPNANLSFSSAIDTNVFNESPYNALYGVVEDARKSLYIMLSDRYKIGTAGLPGYIGPTNIDQLLSGSATKANVQDSLYSDTGWANARYEGTEQTYTGTNVSPATTGKSFLAVEYPISASLSQINYQLSSSLAIYTDYFYTGIGDTPGFKTQQLNIMVSGSNYTSDTSYVDVRDTINSLADPFIYLPTVGSTIAFDGTSTFPLKSSFEVGYVTGISRLSTSPNISYRISLFRRYPGTTESAITSPISLTEGDTIYSLISTQIYQLQKNKLIGVNKSKLLVQETGQVLTLNDYGYVVG